MLGKGGRGSLRGSVEVGRDRKANCVYRTKHREFAWVTQDIFPARSDIQYCSLSTKLTKTGIKTIRMVSDNAPDYEIVNL